MNILLFKSTHEEAFEDPYVTHFIKTGFNTKLISPITFSFCNESKLCVSLQNPTNYSGLILSSPRCVNAIAQAADIHAIDLSQWCVLPAFVIGEATEKAARDLGLSVEGSDCGDASILSDLITSRTFPRPLLYPRSNLARDVIKKRLEEAGIFVDDHIVYQTETHPHLKDEIHKVIDMLPAALVFFSPSGVSSVLPILHDLGVDLGKQRTFAIGSTTEKSLIENGVDVTATAEKPTPEHLRLAVSSCST